MYLIDLACSCQIELSPAHDVPVFHRSARCLDEHGKVPYHNSRVVSIREHVNADEVLAEFDFDAENVELTGHETWQ